MRMRVNQQDIRRLTSKLRSAPVRVSRNLENALDEIGKDLLAASLVVVPRDTEDLAKSGDYDVKRGGNPSVTVFFDEEYAIYQHEALDWKHPPPEQAKYLEGPFNANKPRYKGMVGDAVRKAHQ